MVDSPASAALRFAVAIGTMERTLVRSRSL
jgi:hypothetical protein